jgi:hypothetical protein
MLGGIALIGTLAGSLGSFFSSGGDLPDSSMVRSEIPTYDELQAALAEANA